MKFYTTWNYDQKVFHFLPSLYFEKIDRFPPMKSDVVFALSWFLWTLELEITYVSK